MEPHAGDRTTIVDGVDMSSSQIVPTSPSQRVRKRELREVISSVSRPVFVSVSVVSEIIETAARVKRNNRPSARMIRRSHPAKRPGVTAFC